MKNGPAPAQRQAQLPLAMVTEETSAKRERTSEPDALAPRPRTPARNSFTHSDAFAFLRSIPDQSVDLVITDPPYESMQLHRAHGTTTRLVENWFEDLPNERLPQLLAEVSRVLKPDRHFYLFCDEITADVIKEQQGITSRREADGSRRCACGLSYWRELIWAKTNRAETAIRGGMGYHYRSASERILFFEKGKRRLADLGVPDVLLASRPAYKAPAGKPLKLCTTLVEQSTRPGEFVMDPFAGSGVVGLAARDAGRHFLLNDLDDSYLLPEVRRIAEPTPPRFLLVTPSFPDPVTFLNALVEAHAGDHPESDALDHDRLMLSLQGQRAPLVRRLAETRAVERPALLRRYLRTTPWARAARDAAQVPAALPRRVETWLRWIDS